MFSDVTIYISLMLALNCSVIMAAPGAVDTTKINETKALFEYFCSDEVQFSDEVQLSDDVQLRIQKIKDLEKEVLELENSIQNKTMESSKTKLAISKKVESLLQLEQRRVKRQVEKATTEIKKSQLSSSSSSSRFSSSSSGLPISPNASAKEIKLNKLEQLKNELEQEGAFSAKQRSELSKIRCVSEYNLDADGLLTEEENSDSEEESQANLKRLKITVSDNDSAYSSQNSSVSPNAANQDIFVKLSNFCCKESTDAEKIKTRLISIYGRERKDASELVSSLNEIYEKDELEIGPQLLTIVKLAVYSFDTELIWFLRKYKNNLRCGVNCTERFIQLLGGDITKLEIDNKKMFAVFLDRVDLLLDLKKDDPEAIKECKIGAAGLLDLLVHLKEKNVHDDKLIGLNEKHVEVIETILNYIQDCSILGLNVDTLIVAINAIAVQKFSRIGKDIWCE